jgi:PAS domain S-box-containing protein
MGKTRRVPTGGIIDITERHPSEQRAEQLYRRLESQARVFDAVLSSIVDFAYSFDRAGRFTYVNQALLDLWGMRLEDAVGKNFHELKYPSELADRLLRQIQQVIDTKADVRDETPYTSPTGAGGYYEYIFSPVLDNDGNVEAVAGSTRDVSARKHVEQELLRSQEELRTLANTLESQVMLRTVELEERNAAVLMQSDQLRQLSVRLMETQDEAGRRTARELHDSAGQLIAALAMNLGRMVRELKQSSPHLLELAESAQSLAKEIENEIRTTSYLLHPPMLDEIGLTAALRWYVDGLKERAGLDVRLDIAQDFARPHRAAELTIFRVIQECLTNIHRHSGSKTASIRVAYEGANIVAEVHDVGKGMNAEQLASLESRNAGVGLRGMRERVRQFAGDLQVRSQPGKGTTVRVVFPALYAV